MLIIVVLLKYKCTSSCLSGATKLIYLMLIVCWLKKTRFYNSGWQVSGQKFNDSSSGEFYQ